MKNSNSASCKPGSFGYPRVCCAIGLCAWAGVLLVSAVLIAQPLATTIENETLKAQYIAPGGQLSLIDKRSQLAFVSFGTLGGGPGGVVSSRRIGDAVFGEGQAIEVRYPVGQRDRVMLFPKLPFALLVAGLHNPGEETVVFNEVKTLSATIDLERPPEALATFGTAGLTAVEKNAGSYVWLAAVEPQSRNGVVFGWLTQERGSGVLFSTREGNRVKVDAALQYGKLRLAPGRSEELETLAIGYFEDARIGLESWADAVARAHRIHLKPQPTGYCTWYSQPHGGASDEAHLAELASFAATNLAPFGFSVVQIDDGWQEGFKRSKPSSPKKDFRSHNPRGPYPHGMKAAADQLKSLGLVPGIWFMPFAGTLGDPFFDEHRDWFAKTADGQPYDTPWGGACLDMSHPGAREHLSNVVSRICRDWGYEYIKIDGLWTGTATKQLYVHSGYKEDDLGTAVFKESNKTAIQIFRDGLKLVRQAAGEKVFILGCNAPQNMRSYGGAFGLVDAMRVGPDNGANLPGLLRGPTFGTRHYFLHRRVWLNDPDPVYVRASMPLNHARLICSWVALSGQLNLSSDWLPGLPPDRLEILRRTMPAHNAVARPVDLFENDLPHLWTVHTPERDVIGVFNWGQAERAYDVPVARFGLNEAAEYTAFDFWGDRFIPSLRGRLQVAVPGESCLVLAIKPKSSHPQVLSSSRHVLQGVVDLASERWDDSATKLSGNSQVVGNDAYEVRIDSGTAKAARAEVSSADQAAGVSASFSAQGSLTRLRIQSPAARRVEWTVQFESTKGK